MVSSIERVICKNPKTRFDVSGSNAQATAPVVA
jgi:hypothetical protein